MTLLATHSQSGAVGWRAGFWRIDRMVNALGRVMSVVGALAASLIMCAMTVDVAYRNLSGHSIPGVFEMVEMALVVAVFLGLATAERTQANVRVTLVTGLLSPKVANVVRIFGLLVSLVIVAWFSFASVEKLIAAYRVGEYKRGIISFPMWPGRAVVAFGFLLLGLELGCAILRRVIAAPDGKPAEAER